MLLEKAFRRRTRLDLLIVLLFILLVLYFRSSPSLLALFSRSPAAPASVPQRAPSLPAPIPRVVHQFTFPGDSVPESHKSCVRGTLMHLGLVGTGTERKSSRTCTLPVGGLPSFDGNSASPADFEFYSWSVDAMLAFIENHSPSNSKRELKSDFYRLFKYLQSPRQVADVARYLLIYEFGGAVLDTGIEPLDVLTAEPGARWARGYPCLLFEEGHGGLSARKAAPGISKSVLACRPKHPLFELVLVTLVELTLGLRVSKDVLPPQEPSQLVDQYEAADRMHADADVEPLEAFQDEREVREALARGEGTGARFLGFVLREYRATRGIRAQCPPAADASTLASSSAADCVQVLTMSTVSDAESGGDAGQDASHFRVRRCSSESLLPTRNNEKAKLKKKTNLSFVPLRSFLNGYCSFIKNRGFVYTSKD